MYTRKIELSAWQWAYVRQEPGMFIRGAICSATSRRTSSSFREACDLIGVEYRNNRRNSISVARRASVALLDEIVGPKR